MSHIFPRSTKSSPPVAVSGKGCYLYDTDGKQYLDASGGAAVSCLGHGDVDVGNAIKAQVDKLAFAHTGFLTSEPAEALADMLIGYAPEGLDRVYLVSGGSEATEAAIKLARQYFVEIGQGERRHLITRKQSYHGNTLGALAAGEIFVRQEMYQPMLMQVSHIAQCFEYRFRADDETAVAYGLRAAQELEDEILRLGPDTVMAFMAEPVVGATLGAVPAVEGYFRRIREICDKYGVLLIFDEVMCGMGRTGHMFACEAEDVSPDILCIAKGFGAGYQPIGAMLCSAKIYEAIAVGSGSFHNGHTYMGHPIAAAAALAVLTTIRDRQLVPRVTEMGTRLKSALQQQFGQHPHIGDIRGRGLFLGVELVEDRESKTPFAASRGLAGKIKTAAMDNGLICYPMSGTVDGHVGDHVLLAPPYIIKDSQIEELVDKLHRSITDALAL